MKTRRPAKAREPVAPRRLPLAKAGAVLALILLTLAAYAPVRANGFLNYDDDIYVTRNGMVARGLTPSSVAWAFTSTSRSNWHPLTWLSHMLDCQLFGLDPAGHHATSVLLHLVNVALLLALLHAATGAFWRSLVVAGLFAVHPLNVESVAWVAERKNVLSTVFAWLVLFAYGAWVRRPSRWRYALVMLALVLGLMAKPMLVTWPFVLLLWDVWPLGRFSLLAPDRATALRLVREKIPLFFVAFASAAVTFVVQRRGGSISHDVPPLWRLLNAVVGYGDYLTKAIWPTRLAVLYPHPGTSLSWVTVLVSAVGLAALTAAVIRGRGRHPAAAVGWAFYVGTLVPVIGLVQVGGQAIADRYAYIPLVGVFIAAVWTLNDALRLPPAVRAGGAVALLVVLAAFTRQEVGYWRDTLTLFERALAVTERNHIAHNNVGVELLHTDLPAALRHLETTAELGPTYTVGRINLGVALTAAGRGREAIPHFEAALAQNARSASAHAGLGLVLSDEGRIGEAIVHLEQAIQLDPGSLEAFNNLGVAYAKAGRLEAAAHSFERALALDPSHAGARANLARARRMAASRTS
jgi:protein O-mannosyl-transferase